MDVTGHARYHPDSVVAQMIAEGIDRPTGVMPPFGRILCPDEIRTLIAFIKPLWTPERRQLPQEQTQRADFAVNLHTVAHMPFPRRCDDR